jgi:signal transduction histidine kinase
MNTLSAAREHTGTGALDYAAPPAPDDHLVVDRAAFAGPDVEDQLHALRSGLAGLAGAIHVLTDRDTELPQDSRQRLESMLVAEVERLQRMVARPEAEQRPADRSEPTDLLDLDRLIEDVVLARTSMGQQVLWSPSGHRVRGRRDALVEALNILLVNAARHAGTAVRIDVVETDGQVRLSVSDRGPGVPAAFRDGIFERGARRQGSPGQGLGLAIARTLVDDLGGSLALDTERERGARFEISLPAVELGGAA